MKDFFSWLFYFGDYSEFEFLGKKKGAPFFISIVFLVIFAALGFLSLVVLVEIAIAQPIAGAIIVLFLLYNLGKYTYKLYKRDSNPTD